MSDPVQHPFELPPMPDTSHLITENDDPVDNIPSEKNQRLLVGALYASWEGAPPIEIDGEVLDAGVRPFLATANVGLFDRPANDPLVPDVLVSNDVEVATQDWSPQGTRSYFVWEHGKPPELVIEIVSNKKGDELARKRLRYGRMRIAYYVVFDAGRQLGEKVLRAYKLAGDRLEPLVVLDEGLIDIEPLGLKIGTWEGTFEHSTGLWLRFFDRKGQLLLTGDEKAEAERKNAEAERKNAEAERRNAEAERRNAEAERRNAEAERKNAEAERKKVEVYAAKLRELGIDPDAV